MISKRNRLRNVALVAGAAALSVAATGCSGGGSSASSQTKDVTITVALFGAPPPQKSLDEFKKSTGITVKWSTIDWDSLQTKIAAASTSNTYFADATDVDWSRVGQEGKLGWFLPMEKYIDQKAYAADMPQLSSFTSNGHIVGVPFDASYLVTTVNKQMFAKAGITTMPKTIDEYTRDLQKVKASGVSPTPLNIPFNAAEGLSTYWYQTTQAFGGSILDEAGKPQFTSPDSPGYKAAQWMVDALKNGLVPAGNINVSDSQGQQTLMAKGVTASTFADYSGNVGSLYDVPASSSVTGKLQYIPTPGLSGTTANVSNPDGIGILKTAKYPEAAAKFIEWFTSAENQADFAGASGPDKVMPGYFLPSRLSGLTKLTSAKGLAGGQELTSMLKTSKPVFPAGAPVWYPQFSNAVYTNLHAAAAGSMSVDAAIKTIADTATKLAGQ
ncbi:extracellular solute-binding protein [Paenarthrobacter sp. DKR-5]|uniref:extracellular solute-binding protein n=1 Tax=Paenarthrobacter sp. DKR-5 TaxID=2835535 RepID=UPI001BDC2F42|nr:extracellular solute-binding protein [Paenarthrobacter sp. DKR-5]MBT1003919.1 extracellular solute-binding protein [Paenarthrobacter sp. DKR-5]